MLVKYVDYKKNVDDQPLELRKIYELMKEDADGQINEAYLRYKTLFIQGGKNERNELTLRFESERDKKLTVVLIKFIKRRQGNFTRLIDLLMEYGRKEGYETLEIECVHSDEMEAFARKKISNKKYSILFFNQLMV
ncbi:hypothetical protein MKY06_30125 [Priestia sp. FSL P4-0332]|uniref:hypothetical protein n=1 Tax=Priestia sp. FSL P4-0332 TaxID=2921634 RepID=UPI0030FA8671